jgi:hypothetical protein
MLGFLRNLKRAEMIAAVLLSHRVFHNTVAKQGVFPVAIFVPF